MIFFQLGSALGKLDEAHSPVGNRDARYVINIAGSWDKAEDDRTQVDWARTAWNDLKKFGTGGNYINFLTEDESSDRIQAALRGAIPKLGQIKKKWDPENVFRTNRNITPA